MRYEWHDGETFEAADASQVLCQLRAGSRSPGKTLREYVAGLAYRVEQYTGVAIKTDTPELVVEGLKEAGVIKPA